MDSSEEDTDYISALNSGLKKLQDVSFVLYDKEKRNEIRNTLVDLVHRFSRLLIEGKIKEGDSNTYFLLQQMVEKYVKFNKKEI